MPASCAGTVLRSSGPTTMIRPSSLPAKTVPEEEMATVSVSTPSMSRSATRPPVCRDQRLMVPSSLEEINSSAVRTHSTEMTSAVCPSKRWSSRPVMS